jgi:phage shock protein A
MALLERVGTLLRANLNDLIDKAEEPEKMIKQVILDMQNQLLQVKTQVAIAIADQHVLVKNRQENADKHAEFMRKADLSVAKGKDDLARAALERALSCQRMMENYEQQVADQKAQVENLKVVLRKLEQKLAEAQSRANVLVSQHRRSRALARAGDAELAMRDSSQGITFDRLENKVVRAAAVSQAKAEMLADNVDEQLTALDRGEQVEKLLAEIKARRDSA